MALLLQPSPKTLSPQPQAPDRSPQRTNQRARYLHLVRERDARLDREGLRAEAVAPLSGAEPQGPPDRIEGALAVEQPQPQPPEALPRARVLGATARGPLRRLLGEVHRADVLRDA